MISPITRIANALVSDDPALPAQLAALLNEVEHLAERDVRAAQREHLGQFLRYLRRAVPFYRSRIPASMPLGRDLSWEDFQTLPLMSRADLRGGHPPLLAEQVPAAFRPIATSTTSGSTGAPITSYRTPAHGHLMRALRRRWHGWHRHDPDLETAFITEPTPPGAADPPHGAVSSPWAGPGCSGPSARLNLRASTLAQLTWLEHRRPAYLSTYPSNLLALLKLSEARGTRPIGLQQVIVSSEPVSDQLRALTERVWGARLVATYSASEVGILGFQAPDAAHYLVQAENVLLEVLDDRDRACAPGQLGRIVVTTLQDAYRPLLRYAIGDYGVLGAPGEGAPRGLPVLRRVVGRERSMVRLPNDAQVWPFFELSELVELAALQQWQLLQRRDFSLRARLVTSRPLTLAEEALVRRVVHEAVTLPLPLEVEYVPSIARTTRGKFVEFVSEFDEAEAPRRP